MPAPGAPQRKPRGSPKADRVGEAAARLLSAVGEGPDAVAGSSREIVRDIVGGGRAKVLDALTDALVSQKATLQPRAVEDIVAGLSGGAKGPPPPDFARAAFALALAADPTIAVGWLLNTLGVRSEDTTPQAVRFPHELAVGALRQVPGAGDLLTRCLRSIAGEKPNADALEGWATLAVRFATPIRATPAPMSYTPDDADATLELLGGLRAQDLPGDVYFLAARLLAISSVEAANRFAGTAAGKAVCEFVPVRIGSVQAASDAAPDASQQLLAGVHSGFDRLAAEIARLRDEVGAASEVETLRAELAAVRDRVVELETERDAERGRAAAAVAARDAGVEHLRAAEARLAAAEEAANQWRAESQRREGELNSQFQSREGRGREEQRKLLGPAVRELCDHFRKLLETTPGSEAIRRAGVSFDGLQRRIIQLIGESDQPRLPRQLLTPPDPEGTADVRAD